MALVAPINLPYNVRTLWFDPNGLDIHAGDDVVVQTVRGTELGVAASDVIEVDEESIKKLKSPLKPVLRLATSEDLAKAAEMERLNREAMPIFKDLARQTSEDMHPVSVEYLLDGDKAIFYFEAEERIDFRELVRKLASQFHVRIDMHQIGVRDEARIIGGIAHCGQEVCCKRLGGEFKPVSIRMAKDQDLSLNPQKISGLCGRLMCCLRYENEAYNDFKSRAPKMGAKIKTPAGNAKVVGLDVPKEIITVQVEGEKPVKVELSGFEEAAEGKRPSVITEEGWEIANREEEMVFESSTIFSTSNFTGEDKLGSAKAIHHPTRSSQKKDDRSNKRGASKAEEAPRKQKRRRSTVISGSKSSAPKAEKDASQASNTSGSSGSVSRSGSKRSTSKSPSKSKQPGKLRPGHRSSGLSGASDEAKKTSSGKKRRGSSSSKGAQKRSNDNTRKSNSKASTEPKRDQGQNTSRTSGDSTGSGGGNRRRRRRHPVKKSDDGTAQ